MQRALNINSYTINAKEKLKMPADNSKLYYIIFILYHFIFLAWYYTTYEKRKHCRSIIWLKLAGETFTQFDNYRRNDAASKMVWYCIRVTKNFETSPKLLLIPFLSGSNIWAAFKIPRQRLLLINACTASQL